MQLAVLQPHALPWTGGPHDWIFQLQRRLGLDAIPVQAPNPKIVAVFSPATAATPQLSFDLQTLLIIQGAYGAPGPFAKHLDAALRIISQPHCWQAARSGAVWRSLLPALHSTAGAAAD